MSLLVTGAGGGIGRAIVREAARNGASVLAHDVSAPAVGEADGPVRAIGGDLTDPAHLRELSDVAAAEGVTSVIAAHGVTGAIPLVRLDPVAAERVMRVNAVSVLQLAEALGPRLASAGGALVAVSSQAGLRAERENAIYSASKWALVAWARALAARSDLGYAVRVLCPGRTDSPMLHEANGRIAAALGVSLEAYAAETKAVIPVGRYAAPEEIAAAAWYLAAPAPAVRPVVLAVTGGEVPW